MNPNQLAQQLKHEILRLTWPSSEHVFGPATVAVVADAPPTEEQYPPAFPFAFIRIDSGIPDADHPDLITQDFSIMVAAEVAGDPLGEFAVVGGPILPGAPHANRGVAEVEERVRFAVEDLNTTLGVAIQVSATATGGTGLGGRARHVARSEFTVSAVCTSAPFYVPPQRFRLVGSVWSWSGEHCQRRFDFVNFRLVYKLGSLPQDPFDGTTVYEGIEASATHNRVDGAHYVVFAQYDSRGGNVMEDGAYSLPVVGATRGP